MSLSKSVADNMEHIQKVFLGVQQYMQQHQDQEELVVFLNAEPPGFRSVAYESASMEIALDELGKEKPLDNWKKFYTDAARAHTFHVDIGLGWAFAKSDISPTPYLESLYGVMSHMVFDGMGYYYGLFKERKTVKGGLIPGVIKEEQNLHGFDQGLGRRLWYISRGDVNEVVRLIQSFPELRNSDLWRGVGIACGYVGGCERAELEQLLELSAGNKGQLRTGIVLAAISRRASNSVSDDINLACNIICNKTVKEVLIDEISLKKQFDRELEIFI